ncbi:hypothetical protein GCM10010277_55250 [Streptomyces longisporoflavus]|uniref:hypothetical protein n=1 Tax=Streptomyces longisporoflavus TaxID=28044 RepID=UPI00167EA599|nr:hypothetical protein [Streptomyces longisporoflavus]GGV55303.1 hypothetical protein GCM10010277_55250 [Streptomyces longisporoflavus]
MNAHDHAEQEPTSVKPKAPHATTLKALHAARAESAAARAAALSHYVEQASAGDTDAAWKAAHAARVAAQALAVLSESGPDPAADSRCARNASASAAQASQMGQLVDGEAESAAHACRAALKASQAAGAAAAAKPPGGDEALNAEADAAERAAVAAAEAAGWIRPGESVPAVTTGVRSPEVMSMMHL